MVIRFPFVFPLLLTFATAATARQPEVDESEIPRAEVIGEDGLREEVTEVDGEEPLTIRAVPREDDIPEAKPVPAEPPPAPRPEPEPPRPRIAVSLTTDPDAKPLSLRVPAPRGQIVDRAGRPLAQNILGHYMGIQLPMEDGLTDAQVLAFAREPMAWVQKHLPRTWNVTDADIIEHYRKRRWLPFLCGDLVPAETVDRIRTSLPKGVALQPFYLRYYPENSTAGHLIGQMGKSGQLPSGEIRSDELLWPPTIGREGLEARFDAELTGEPGRWTVLYDAKGVKISEEWVQRPKAGNTVVTALDLRWQKIVEREMKQRGIRGAFCIMDVRTGDLLVCASTPVYDPNQFAYGVSEEVWKKLLSNKEKPLIPRALQGVYPPASTFKVVTALAALESGKMGPDTHFPCPPAMKFGDRWMRNHTRNHEGDMDVVRAIARSCNTWFFQAARVAGGPAVTSMAIRMGFGSRTGICLESMESSGNMPTPEYYEKRGTKLAGGTLANISIGQGEVEATPLQVCQMMAAVARGDAVPRPRLVRHIQDVDGRIVKSFPPTIHGTLNLSRESLNAVRRGMRAVVSSGGGTGTRAANKYVSIAGKTGTGQWHVKPVENVAWFAGFIPAGKPEYAFAALYEGDPGETEISGGRKVAPLVGDVFNEIYRMKKEAGEIPDDQLDEDDGAAVAASSPKRREQQAAAPQVSQTQAAPAQEKPKRESGLRRFFRRLRGGD